MLHNLVWLRDLDILYDASTFDTDPFEPQPEGMETIFPFWVPAAAAAAEDRRSEIEDGAPYAQKMDDGRSKMEDGSPTDAPVQSSSLVFNLTTSSRRRPQSSNFNLQSSPRRASAAAPAIEAPYTLVQDFNLFIILKATSFDI